MSVHTHTMWPHTDQFQSIQSDLRLIWQTPSSLSLLPFHAAPEDFIFPWENSQAYSSALLTFNHSLTHTHTQKKHRHLSSIEQQKAETHQDCDSNAKKCLTWSSTKSSALKRNKVQRNFLRYVTCLDSRNLLTEKLSRLKSSEVISWNDVNIYELRGMRQSYLKYEFPNQS